MKNKKFKRPVNFSEHLDQQYGKPGSKKRERYEEEFDAFKLGVLIQEMREKRAMTQQELADRCGTTKSYISRIENNVGDIRLSTLMRIIQDGLGARLRLSLV